MYQIFKVRKCRKIQYPNYYYYYYRLSTVSMVEVNSSLVLGLSMTMYSNESYTHSYTDIISLMPDDILYFQLALQSNNSFVRDVNLQVVSCWSTESTNPEDTVQGIILQDGCVA